MGRNTLIQKLESEMITLVLLYQSLATAKIKVHRLAVPHVVREEGDDIIDWYIEEDRKNERLRKKEG